MPLPTDPVSIGLLALIWNAIAAAPGGIPTELTGALLGDTIKGGMSRLRKRLEAGKPGANHDLRRALTDAFWLSLLHVAARHGERVNQPVPWPAKLNQHEVIGRTWRFLRQTFPGGQPSPGLANQAVAETVRILYPKLIAKLQDSLDAPPAGIDAAYAGMEALLLRAPPAEPLAFLQTLKHEAARHFDDLAAPNGVPAAMQEDLARDFEELFRGAFAEAVKTRPEVSAILNATLLAGIKEDTAEIKKILHERLPPAALPGAPPDPTAYIDYLRKNTGSIELVGLRVGANLDPIPIDKLWVAARTRSTGAFADEATSDLSVALNGNRVLVIEGVAGSGKSTFLKRIAYALCREDAANETLQLAFNGLPLWLPVTMLETYLNPPGEPKPPPTVADLRWIALCLADLSAKKSWGLGESFFSAQLQDPAAILLLDGLDEASGPWRPVLAKLILEARGCFKCRIAVTMRPEVEYSAPLLAPIKERCSILDLETPEIEEFLRLWTEHVPSNDIAAARADAAGLLANLQSNRAIGKMACNPLMLSVLAALTRRGVPLPEERASLYGAIVTWLARSRYDSANQEKTLLSHLSLLSLGMIERDSGNKYQIGYGDAAALIAKNFRPAPPVQKVAAAEEFLADAQLRCGLIKERGGDLVFCHREFQEYLAANYLAHARDADREGMAVKFLTERRAPEVLRLLAGCLQASGSNERLSDLFVCLIEYATPLELEPRAYAAGVIGGMRADLLLTSFRMSEELQAAFDGLVKSVMAIFDLAESKKIAIPIRRDAAEALAHGGDPRLRLPRKDLDKRYLEYWVKVRDFMIGQYPVTVYEYGVYLERTGCEQPDDWEEQVLHPSTPVTTVSWHEAVAYCEWAGGRLPTEEEWEFAARVHGSAPGSPPREFPWGNEEPTPERANYRETGLQSPTPVGLFPAGATPGERHDTRIFDLAGNVWEWTSSRDDPGGNAVLRGGAFLSYASVLRAAYRSVNPPGARDHDIGFRCVRELFS